MSSRTLLAAALAALPVLSTASAQTLTDPGLTVAPFATGLNLPTQMRFIGTNDVLVTEKNTGRVRRIVDGVTQPNPVLDLNVSTSSERGLLGLTLDPGFATNGFVYLYYSATTGSDGGAWLDNRLTRFTWNGTALGNQVLLQTFGTAADGLPQGPNHDGGPLTFGPDGKIYGVTGDLNRSAAEQNNQSLPGTSARVGGVYRLNADGSTPSDNPFVLEADVNLRRWYGYGVRNSYGLAFDPVTGNLWDTENGPDQYDEINLVQRGSNSGWIKIMGPDSRDPQGVADLVTLNGAFYSDPEFSFLSPVAVTGLVFTAGSALGSAYDNALLVADSNNGNIYRFTLNATRTGFVLSGGLADLVADNLTERNSLRLGTDFGALTDLQIGPDGAVYATSIGEGTIYRLVPEPTGAALLLLGFAALAIRRKRHA